MSRVPAEDGPEHGGGVGCRTDTDAVRRQPVAVDKPMSVAVGSWRARQSAGDGGMTQAARTRSTPGAARTCYAERTGVAVRHPQIGVCELWRTPAVLTEL